jgi:hypothetical protein
MSDVIFYYNGINVDHYGIGINIKNITEWEFRGDNLCNRYGNKLNLTLLITIDNVTYKFCYKREITPEFYKLIDNELKFKTYFLKNPNVSNVGFYFS